MIDKPRLSQFAQNGYSQFGEEGCLAAIHEKIGVGGKVCVEFGAGDGIDCSNTAQLWRHEGWQAVLIEADDARFDALVRNAVGYDVTCLQAKVAPTGPYSLGELLYADDAPILTERIDFLSIDVDGDDAHILEEMVAVRPRVICCEFNPSCPSHLEIRQRELGETFGASLLAIVRLGARIGYRFVGATYCNAFLVIEEEAAPFDGYETDLTVLFPPENYTYAVSDFGGRMVLAGQAPPWQAHGPYVPALDCSGYVTAICDDPAYLRTGFEALWGAAEWFTAAGLDRERLRAVLASGVRLVCVDLSGGTLGADEWIAVGAEFAEYRAVQAGPVLGLVRQ